MPSLQDQLDQNEWDLEQARRAGNPNAIDTLISNATASSKPSTTHAQRGEPMHAIERSAWLPRAREC